MPVIRINGVEQDFPEGLSLLQACRRMSLDIPALCHDDRLRPTGACRLCSVEIEGSDRLVTACTTPLVDGMVVQTHSPGVESIRRTLLGLMAERHPGDPDAATHPTPFQQELLRHQVSVGAAVGGTPGPGERHPCRSAPGPSVPGFQPPPSARGLVAVHPVLPLCPDL
ncbi:MAG: 2Fe-2S iron-sulfur cluster-binding protein [Verrucomicrobiota bacterium]